MTLRASVFVKRGQVFVSPPGLSVGVHPVFNNNNFLVMTEFTNEYYQLKSSDGRERKFKTPAQFGQACNAYFKWAVENPLYEEVVHHYQGRAVVSEIKRIRPFSLEGLCHYLDICVSTFRNYEKREDFLIVTARVRQIIEVQQFEGSVAGLLNANIISRKLGLTEKQDYSTNGKDLNQITIFEIPNDGRNDGHY